MGWVADPDQTLAIPAKSMRIPLLSLFSVVIQNIISII
jgi:hypothetical protein